MKAARVLLVVALALATAGCTEVPSHSGPQVVQPIANSGQNPEPPPKGGGREIVIGFLQENAADPGTHVTAREYLTVAARNRWSDATATIVQDIRVGNYRPGHPILVTGTEVGTLDANGVFTPALASGTNYVDPMVMKKVGAQYRIDALKPGLLLTLAQFESSYLPHTLYFFDLDQHYLVPDVRYTDISDTTQLADWLLAQLAAGPREELRNAVSPDSLPSGPNSRGLKAKIGTVTRIEVPGASQLDGPSRESLAAQLSVTFADVAPGGALTITDAGKPVSVPSVGLEFHASDYARYLASTSAPQAKLYYLRGGRVVDAAGHDLVGSGVSGNPPLTAVALTSTIGLGDTAPLLVAGLVGNRPNARLYVGSQDGGLKPTSLRGALSRPEWAPGRQEVWVGDGKSLYRVIVGGTTIKALKVALPSSTAGAQIVAVRISPEGARIALVVSGNGTSQLLEGAIVRTAGAVRVDTLLPISPQGLYVEDVAWTDPVRLIGIGYLATSQDARVFETGIDGAGWTVRGITGLPDGPNTITAAPKAIAWVSVGDTVWKQDGSAWVSPGASDLGQTAGSAPIYVR